MTDTHSSPAAASPAFDPLAPEIAGARFSLFDFYRASVQAGGGVTIEGRTFTDCQIDGPALMLVLDGVHFGSTNFGPSNGDMRNMLFRPLGDVGIGAIPVRNCTFTRCRFQTLGFTGNDEFLELLTQQVAVG